MSDLEDIRDVCETGLDEVRGAVEDVGSNAEKLQEVLEELKDSVEQSLKTLELTAIADYLKTHHAALNLHQLDNKILSRCRELLQEKEGTLDGILRRQSGSCDPGVPPGTPEPG